LSPPFRLLIGGYIPVGTQIGSVALSNGVFECSFTSTPGATFTVLSATNPALPLSDWSLVGAAAEVSPGEFQFSDPQSPNSPQRYYNLLSP
jgi:hypothetical protein